MLSWRIKMNDFDSFSQQELIRTNFYYITREKKKPFYNGETSCYYYYVDLLSHPRHMNNTCLFQLWDRGQTGPEDVGNVRSYCVLQPLWSVYGPVGLSAEHQTTSSWQQTARPRRWNRRRSGARGVFSGFTESRAKSTDSHFFRSSSSCVTRLG